MHKPIFLTGWLRKSHLLTADEFERLTVDAEVLERDANGIKVLRLQNGDILKLFRGKHLVSSARIYSHARSFCRNAERLRLLGVPTMMTRQLFHFPDRIHSAVLYQPLPGITLRQLALAGALDQSLLKRMAGFVANLHEHGVLFRSLHFGNILQTPQGELGLIDIADLSIQPFALSCAARLGISGIFAVWRRIGWHSESRAGSCSCRRIARLPACGCAARNRFSAKLGGCSICGRCREGRL